MLRKVQQRLVLTGMIVITAAATVAWEAHPSDSPSSTRALSPRLATSSLGFGGTTPGGSGRHTSPPRTTVMRVTNRGEYGLGSLRACVEFNAPRTCIFEVAGEIRLSSPLRVSSPYLTIAGQTAPSPGITITGSTLAIQTHDVIVQHITVRPGDRYANDKPGERDAISIGTERDPGTHHILIDHVTATWAIDENLSLWYPTTHDVTIANSLLAEGLDNSIHPKGRHSKGLMVGNGVIRVTIMRNLLAHNIERNPYLKPGSSAEVVNNVVYGWGPGGGWSLCNVSDNDGTREGVSLIFEGNYYKTGPASAVRPPIYGHAPSPATRIFARDNFDPVRGRRAERDWDVVALPESPYRSDTPPFASSGVAILPLPSTLDTVLQNVGSRPWERSPIDQRILNDVQRGEGSIKDCLTGCAKAVGDIPNIPETRRSLTPPQVPFGDDNHDGITNLEEWLRTFSVRE